MNKIKYIVLLSLISQCSWALKPDSVYYYKPEAWGIMYREYKVKTPDNYTLNMWFIPAQEPLKKDSMTYYFNKKTEKRPFKEDNTSKKPTIIVCNGDAGNMSYLISYIYHYSSNGFNVITFDWRGFGQSEPFSIDTNMLVYKEFIDDYNTVVDFVTQISTVDKDKIGVFGFSTGAFLSYVVSHLNTNVKAIVARGIFTDYKMVKHNLIRDEYPSEIDAFSPRSTWGLFNKPIFLIVGELDNITPKEYSIEILKNIKSEVRELWVVKGAYHGGNKAPEIIQNDLFFKKTVRFFKENL